MCTSTTGCWCSLDIDPVLRGRQLILTMWEMDLERREKKLAEE
jgi:hypothetical protein